MFKFDKNYYLQVQGTAMGTRVTPTYVIIFMNDFESRHIYTYHNSPKYYFRFIDDILGIFKGTQKELLEFFDHCYRAHNTIKFSWEYSKESVNFLDLIIFKAVNNELHTKLFIKPTDS